MQQQDISPKSAQSSRLDRTRGLSFSLPSPTYLFGSSPPPPDSFSDNSSDSSSSTFSSYTSPSSSIASSPCLAPTRFSPIPDDLGFLSDARPSPSQVNAYAASIIRAEAYALLALAARMTPSDGRVPDDECLADFSIQPGPDQDRETRTSGAFIQAINALAALPAHGKILVSGVGKSGIAGRKIVATLNSLGELGGGGGPWRKQQLTVCVLFPGISSVFLHPLEALHGDLGVVCPCNPSVPCDAAILLSHSGATAELMRLLPILRPRVRTMIAITRDPDSILARGCAHWLDAGTGAYAGGMKDGEKVTDEADSALPAPTSSVITALAIGDAVALSLSRMRLGWDKGGKARRAAFLRCHPGGQLGIEVSLFLL